MASGKKTRPIGFGRDKEKGDDSRPESPPEVPEPKPLHPVPAEANPPEVPEPKPVPDPTPIPGRPTPIPASSE